MDLTKAAVVKIIYEIVDSYTKVIIDGIRGNSQNLNLEENNDLLAEEQREINQSEVILGDEEEKMEGGAEAPTQLIAKRQAEPLLQFEKFYLDNSLCYPSDITRQNWREINQSEVIWGDEEEKMEGGAEASTQLIAKRQAEPLLQFEKSYLDNSLCYPSDIKRQNWIEDFKLEELILRREQFIEIYQFSDEFQKAMGTIEIGVLWKKRELLKDWKKYRKKEGVGIFFFSFPGFPKVFEVLKCLVCNF